MESYQRLIDVIAIENLQMRAEHWLLTQVLVWSTLGQVAATLAALGVAYALSRPLRDALRGFIARSGVTETAFRGLAAAAISVAFPLLALILLAAAIAVASGLGWPDLLMTTGVNLLAAWIVIRLLSRLIRNDFWSRLIAILAFGVATLNIVGLLEPTIVYLDQIGFRLAETRVSMLDILKGAVALGVLLWLALTASRLLEQRVQRARSLTPSLRVLTSKLLRFSLIALALVVALTSVGIDLTAFAALHRRARRRHRLRPAEAHLQPDQRAHSPVRPLDQARRRRGADRPRRPIRTALRLGDGAQRALCLAHDP